MSAAAAGQAAAHTGLDTSSPGANATLAGLPPRITLTFTDAMAEKYAKVAVTASDGTSAAAGRPRVDGRTVTLPLKAGAPAGRYTVGYRVVSADGHPVSGSYPFTVKVADNPSPSAGRGTADTSIAPASGETDRDDAASPGVRGPVLAGAGALAAAGIAAVIGAGVFAARRRRARHGD
ncbi:copper resistance protein CopC [Streptomyces sp. NBS 14/10]|uniref:copper resistance CopC family protein n=1 Tax=Streptomyces sp. NBS 14/10 TaxID=1945643 RepID=UPI0015C66BDE|nr:copper resistance CopC family protein [Streptomyces sp. NBS 14/10]KAK1177075.1 copper resistance protein CopC [Streptomyces sp. NBS 14/10]NUS86314.1 copper resistance protein CopC [Streptomyces sp.]